MLWQYVLTIFLNWGWTTANEQTRPAAEYMDLAEGVYFKELSPETIDVLHHCAWYEKDNSSDKSDPTLYVYSIPMPDHKGHFYTVVFSYNYQILQITNDYSHS